MEISQQHAHKLLLDAATLPSSARASRTVTVGRVPSAIQGQGRDAVAEYILHTRTLLGGAAAFDEFLRDSIARSARGVGNGRARAASETPDDRVLTRAHSTATAHGSGLGYRY